MFLMFLQSYKSLFDIGMRHFLKILAIGFSRFCDEMADIQVKEEVKSFAQSRQYKTRVALVTSGFD